MVLLGNWQGGKGAPGLGRRPHLGGGGCTEKQKQHEKKRKTEDGNRGGAFPKVTGMRNGKEKVKTTKKKRKLGGWSNS